MELNRPSTLERIRQNRLVLPIIGSLALSLSTGCLPEASAWRGPSNGIRVGVVGDSQTFQAENGSNSIDTNTFLTDQIVASGDKVSISAEIGAVTSDLIPGSDTYFDGWPSPGAQVIVEALGTNDLRVDSFTHKSNVPIVKAKQNLTKFLNDSSASCIELVEVPETPQWGLNKTGVIWNSYLRSMKNPGVRQEHVVIVPWAETVAQHPGYVNRRDGVHQTAVGKTAFRKAIMTGIEKCVRLISEPTKP